MSIILSLFDKDHSRLFQTVRARVQMRCLEREERRIDRENRSNFRRHIKRVVFCSVLLSFRLFSTSILLSNGPSAQPRQ